MRLNNRRLKLIRAAIAWLSSKQAESHQRVAEARLRAVLPDTERSSEPGTCS